MCELDILHDSLYQFCPELHLKRQIGRAACS
ncbi:hypothetical protein, partial [Enterobacter hormaechei]